MSKNETLIYKRGYIYVIHKYIHVVRSYLHVIDSYILFIP